MNIIVIYSDTLRKDHLSCYGNKTVIAPNLQSFAEKALVFDRFYPASFPTVPCRADFLTGRYTFTYLPWGPLPQDEITLPSLLTSGGYVTGAVADTPFLTRNGYGQDRGFLDFIYVRGQLNNTQRDPMRYASRISESEAYCAPKTFKEAADWLQLHYKEQFFLYIDTWDPHEPWDPPEYYVKPYYPDYKGEVIPPNYWDYQEDGYSERDMEIAHAAYMGEISMVDHWFGYFMERLRVLGLMENTAILFLSDHGFYFGEHGLFGKRRFRWPDGSGFEEGYEKGNDPASQIVHRSPLHNEITQIPLLMYLPGESARRIDALAMVPDLMPTILDLAQVDGTDRIQAPSMLPLIHGEVDSIHDFIVTSTPLEERGELTKTVDDFSREVAEISPASITDGSWDLLYSVYGQKAELFRTDEDPGHLNDVFEENRPAAEKLHGLYVEWLKEQGTAERYIKPRSRI